LEINFSALKQKIIDNRKTIFFLIILFFLAMSVRSNLVRYDGNYLFEPDAFYHARMAEYLTETGTVPAIDPLSYYQEEQGGATSEKINLYWIVSAIVYWIVGFGQPFNKELFAFTIQFMPTIFGGLITIAAYFLGKEIFNDKKIGLVTAFLAAITPAFVYRTMSGAQGNNSLGFLWMIIGLVFLVRAVKKKQLNKKEMINAGLAGLFFGIMAVTWRMHLLIPTIIIPYLILGVIKIASTAEPEKDLRKNEVIIFSIKAIVPLIIYTIFILLYGENWFSEFFWYVNNVTKLPVELMQVIIPLALIAGIALMYFISNLDNESKKAVNSLFIMGLFAILITIAGFFFIVPDLMDRTQVTSLVGEESLGYNSFGTKYNALIVLPVLGLLAFPIFLFLSKKEDSHTMLIFWLFTLITLFMAWYKLKFTFVFGLGIVTAGALVAYIIFELINHFGKSLESKSIIIPFVFILLLGVGSTALFVPDYAPFPNQDTRWISIVDWIKENTPQDAKFFNWWNEGHLISFVTERRVSSDNRNFTARANEDYSEFLLTDDVARGYEIATKNIGADYILLESDSFTNLGSFYFYMTSKIDYKGAQNYSGFFRTINCTDAEGGKVCGGQLIPEQEIKTIFNSNWTTTPNDFIDGTTPVYYYFENNKLTIIGLNLNKTNLAKVFFNSEETQKYYEEVFNANGIKIFKIKK